MRKKGMGGRWKERNREGEYMDLRKQQRSKWI